jgi:tRNA(Leu) C34 or U34 (ribose-2'-O)-methylase TrmL
MSTEGSEPGPTEWSTPATGVGPWPGPVPDDPRYDAELLEHGDARNVVDAYRYWRREAIIADIDRRRHRLHVAIENFGNDANIGAVVRTANAFAVDTVHIVGRRRWNRRGAMVTDRYQRLVHHDTTEGLLAFARDAGITVVAVDNVGGAVRLEETTLPRDCLLVFGQEGPGISEAARCGAAVTVSIAQFGSTRSINAGAAVRAVLELLGVKDCLSKCYGSSNPKNLVKATFEALAMLQTRERIEALRGVTLGTTAVEDAIARGMAFMPKSSGGPRAQAPVNTVGDERRGGRGGRGGPRGGGGGRRFDGGDAPAPAPAPAAAPAAPTTDAPAADAPSAG